MLKVGAIKSAVLALTLMLSGVLSTNALATPLIITGSGTLAIENAPGGLVGVTSSNICFFPICLSPTAVFMDASGADPAVFQTGTNAGTISNLVGGAALNTPFMTVTGRGAEAGNTINFDFSSLVINTGATIGNCTSNAAFNSCTPAGSPFTFIESSTGTQLGILFTALLKAYTGTSATGSTAYEALFTIPLGPTLVATPACNGEAADITNALSCLAAGGEMPSVWSASGGPQPADGTTTPLPAALPLFATGLGGLGLLGWRRKRKAQAVA